MKVYQKYIVYILLASWTNKCTFINSDVLQTVHLIIFISVINQLDAQNFCFTIRLFHASTCFEHMCSSSGGQNCITQPLVSSHLCLYMFRAHVLIIRRSKLHYTASCIITPMPLHVSRTCAHHQEVKIALHSLWYHHTYRCDDTRGCIMQFWPPDDEHMCSKHVEVWNKLIVKQKFCASSWLITEINKSIFMSLFSC